MATHRRTRRGRLWLSGMILLGVIAQVSLSLRDPVKDFCRRFGHQTAVVDRKLYIDGGLINWNPMTTDPGNYTNSWLVYHDLDDAPLEMPQIHTGLNKNASIPSVHGGALWSDNVNYRLFLFGGEFQNGQPTDFNFLSYDIWYNQWDNYGSPGSGIRRASYGAATNVDQRGEGYYYGGYFSNASVPGWTGPPQATCGLIRYTMDDNSFANITGPDSIGRAEGVMTFIPVSDNGMLVYLGGVQDPFGNGTFVAQPMEEIFLYDVVSNKWHVQNATGTIPEYRRKFCAGAAWADDGSSYNIYVTSGDGFDGPGFDDIYILSLPTFTWIKTYPLDRNGTGDYPSHSLTCNVVNNGAQMLTIGGTFPLTNTCDYESVWGLHNIDMGSTMPDSFQDVWVGYDPNVTGYNVPPFVSSIIGGNNKGGARQLKPEGGDFANHDLGLLLEMKPTFKPRTRMNDGRADPATTTGTSDKGGLPKEAIIGIAVGCSVALLALVALTWFLCARHHHKTKKPKQGVKPLDMPPQGLTSPPQMSPYYDHPSSAGGSMGAISPHSQQHFMTMGSQQGYGNGNGGPLFPHPYPSPYSSSPTSSSPYQNQNQNQNYGHNRNPTVSPPILSLLDPATAGRGVWNGTGVHELRHGSGDVGSGLGLGTGGRGRGSPANWSWTSSTPANSPRPVPPTARSSTSPHPGGLPPPSEMDGGLGPVAELDGGARDSGESGGWVVEEGGRDRRGATSPAVGTAGSKGFYYQAVSSPPPRTGDTPAWSDDNGRTLSPGSGREGQEGVGSLSGSPGYEYTKGQS